MTQISRSSSASTIPGCKRAVGHPLTWRTEGWDRIRDNALNQSPFPKPKSMFKILEDSASVSGLSKPKRKAGTYPNGQPSLQHSLPES